MTLARRLLLALWAGLLVSVGAVVAPMLFGVLADRALAGTIAGSLFRVVTVISAAIAALLAALAANAPAAAARRQQRAALGPALLLSVSEFLVRPELEAARAAGGAAGAAFGAWHAVSSVLYWGAAVWVVAALVRELRH